METFQALVFQVPFWKRAIKQMVRYIQSTIMAIQTPRTPIPKFNPRM